MRLWMPWALMTGLVAACLLKPTFVSMSPDYGYVDGCFPVLIQGHRLGENATGDIGGVPFLSLAAAETDPSRPDHAQDVGFVYHGVAPPAPDGAVGWYDVNLVVEGEKLTLKDYVYYQACPSGPGVPQVDASELFDADTYGVVSVAAGSPVSFVGCNLVDTLTLEFLNVADGEVVASAPLTPTCSTAEATSEVPASLAAGDYLWRLVDGGAPVLFESCHYDTGATVPTCTPFTVTVTGRRGE